jgi:imidazolonepropionase-like amidohydrolase
MSAPAPADPDSSPAVLFAAGRVIDGSGSPAFSADVLVEGNRIVAVGEEATIRAAKMSRIRRIDIAGLTLMPGLIDAHCHVSFDAPRSNDELFFHRRAGLAAIIAAADVRKLLCAGVTGLFDADSIHDIGVDLRDAIDAGVVEGPRMAAGGHALMTSVGGTAGRLIPDGGLRGYAVIVRTRDEIVAEVRRQIKGGVDWIKVHVTGLIPRQRARGELTVWSFDELRAVCDTAHALGIPVVGHCRNASSTRDAARAGFDMILHATHMDEQALEAVVERKIPIVPTFTFQANLADYGNAVNADKGLQDLFRREIADSAGTLRRLHAAGVPLLCGTESGFSLTPLGDWHYRELEVFVRDLGFSPLQAIRAATWDAARALRMESEVGGIVAGQLADLIVIDGDPSIDVTLLGERSRFRYVMADGRFVDLGRQQPARRSIPGWRVSQYSGDILTRDRVRASGIQSS